MNKRRININIHGDIDDEKVLYMVLAVVLGGRISNNGEQYSYATTFHGGYVVVTDITKAGHDTFHVYRQEQ